MATADIHVRVDGEVKEETEKILREIGLTISDLVNMTFRRTILERGIPFETRLTGVPENMRIETKKQLVEYLNKTSEKAGDKRYTTDEMREELGLNNKRVVYRKGAPKYAKV